MTEAAGFDLFSLKDKVFVVTGASSGIGLAIARGFAGVGAVVGLNSRDPAKLAARCREIPRSFPLPFDVADLAAAEAALDRVAAEHGRLDGIVCNAAARDRRPWERIEPADFRALLETNLVAPFQMARVAARHMLKRGEGRIIFIASLAGEFARPGDPAYPGAKGGLAGIMRALACDLGPRGINVNAIAPGTILSETNKPYAGDPAFTAMIERRVPLKRWAQPSELAGAAIFLASAAGSYVNGHLLYVDGGTSIQMLT
jgi:gluconate 5-dehydrogenase